MFDATGTNPIGALSGSALSGQVTMKPVHVEIDDVRPLAPLLAEETMNDSIPLVTVEFTTPGTDGQEQVYMVGKYVN